MNSRDYWAKRAALDMVAYMRTAEQTAALMDKAGKSAARYISAQTKGIFSAFQSFGISEAEARRVLSAANDKTALQALRAAAAKIKDETARKAFTEAINSAGAYRFRIDRLEEVGRQITQTCNSLYKTQLAQTSSCLSGVASNAYYHTIFNLQKQTGLAFSFAQFPKGQVDKLLKTHWTGASYSQRIWKNTNALADRLKDELLIGLMSGRSQAKTARVIREAFGSNSYCARRLVRTESAYVANAAVDAGYDEAGIERYIFVATLDAKTSEVCAELDGKSFDRKDAKPGTNFPPMHPWCRSTTIADFGEDTLKGLERRARDENGNTVKVSADMGYNEWKKSLDIADDGNLFLNTKPGKADNTRTNFNVINSEAYEAKFSSHYNNLAVSEAVTSCCRNILKNRDGTNYEEMYAVDSRTGKILTYIKGKSVNGVGMTDKLKKLLTNSRKGSIIIVHNHPNSATFSKKDVGTALKYPSIAETVAAGHDGTVYFVGDVFGHDNAIRDYSVAYTKYTRDKLPDFEARNVAWKSVAENLGFKYERR